MIGLFCFVLFAVLGLRSLALAGFEPKPPIIRLGNVVLALFFGTCAVLVFAFAHEQFLPGVAVAAVVVLLLSGVAAGSVHMRVKRQRTQGLVPVLMKTILVLCVLCVSMLVVMMSGFLVLTEDRPLIKLILTGNTRQEHVVWQPPNGTPQNQTLTDHEIVFQTPEGKPLATVFLYGDQLAVKVKIVRFRPILNLLGVRNLARVDYIYNGYTTAERHNFYPHHAEEIPMGNPALEPFQKTFWRYWEDLYYGKSRHTLIIESATLESNFFPLVDQNGAPVRDQYFLTVNTGGLSAIPLP
jgi:hypothetical protein